MGQFYFHVASTDEFIPDYQGSELHDLSACHQHALRIIRECIPFVEDDPRRWWIDIADASGRSALTVLYPCRFVVELRRRAGGPASDSRYRRTS